MFTRQFHIQPFKLVLDGYLFKLCGLMQKKCCLSRCVGVPGVLDGFMHLGIEIPVLISCWSGENDALVGLLNLRL